VVFLEGHLEQMEKLPWLAGFHWWVFADFGSSCRSDSIPHVNQKGLVSFWREKKEKNLYEKLGEGRDQ
jgi:beta-galactosidase